MQPNETRINSSLTIEIQDFYTTKWALDDLVSTIPSYPEKQHLMETVKAELVETEKCIRDWWIRVGKLYGKEFSPDASIRFDRDTIYD